MADDVEDCTQAPPRCSAIGKNGEECYLPPGHRPADEHVNIIWNPLSKKLGVRKMWHQREGGKRL